MDASNLTSALVLEVKTRVADGGGGWTITWLSLGTLWAAISTSRATEDNLGARAHARITHRVTVRSASETSPRRPSADQRFLAGNRIFDIVGVSEARNPGFLDCWCVEGPLS